MRHSLLSARGLRAKASTAHARITRNRTTAAFFVVSFLYCFAQGLVQSLLFSTDQEYVTLVDGIVRGGAIPDKNTTFLTGDRSSLVVKMCNDIPHGQTPDPCFAIFEDVWYANASMASAEPTRTLVGWEAGMTITPAADPANPALITNVTVTPSGGPSVVLSEQCIQILVYPSQILHNMRREDITWIVLQFWLLAISFIAILNDSVPHVLAVLMTRTISTGWAGYAVWRGPFFEAHFEALVQRAGGPCAVDLGFTGFWERRANLEITDLVLSTTGLIFFGYLSWTLLQIYNAQAFKRLGAPEHVMRIHKFYMALLACLQMETFALAAGMGLWINVLFTTSMLHISAHTHVYEALYVSTVILLLPWISMGWYSIRQERKKMMICFLAIGFIITAGWAILFYSIVFRWVFMQWPYLGCWTVGSFILLFASMTLGVVCRVNFGKGLAEYLHAESALASLNFAPDSFDVKEPDSLSRASSMRKDTLDFKDANGADGDFMSAPPLYFVSSLMPQGEPADVRGGPDISAEEDDLDSDVSSPYMSERSPASLNVHPELGTLSGSSSSSSDVDVESGRAVPVPVRPRREGDGDVIIGMEEAMKWDSAPRPRPF